MVAILIEDSDDGDEDIEILEDVPSEIDDSDKVGNVFLFFTLITNTRAGLFNIVIIYYTYQWSDN